VSGDRGRDLVGDLLDELEALLSRAAAAGSPLLRASAPPPRPTPATSWQEYANELRDLCRRVLEEADEATAVAFWSFLIATAARHRRRAGGSSS
jgi:hypothetical protein